MTPEPADEAIRVDDVRLAYPERRGRPARPALAGVSLSIRAGESLALLGPNGSGKSTLLKVIAALLPPDRGSASVLGRRDPEGIRALLGVVFQSPALDPHLTVRENLRDHAALYGIAPNHFRNRLEEDLRRSGLEDRANSLVKTLSGGLARRVDLIRALLHAPRVLLLDEPTAGLDPAARERFLEELLRRTSDLGTTILMSTHLIDEADRCQRVALMHDGRVVAEGAPDRLRAALGGWRVVLCGADSPPAALSGLAWTGGAGGWSASIDAASDSVARISAALADVRRPFSMAPPSLATVFEAMTGTVLEPEATTGSAARSRRART